mmetsp:Transcript_56077/g.121277  ORF Transcript_56077/g.121277 Transcript_56077/m.121277 type:complete len:314 (-) Transcript_56077:17-958(-)
MGVPDSSAFHRSPLGMEAPEINWEERLADNRNLRRRGAPKVHAEEVDGRSGQLARPPAEPSREPAEEPSGPAAWTQMLGDGRRLRGLRLDRSSDVATSQTSPSAPKKDESMSLPSWDMSASSGTGSLGKGTVMSRWARAWEPDGAWAGCAAAGKPCVITSSIPPADMPPPTVHSKVQQVSHAAFSTELQQQGGSDGLLAFRHDQRPPLPTETDPFYQGKLLRTGESGDSVPQVSRMLAQSEACEEPSAEQLHWERYSDHEGNLWLWNRETEEFFFEDQPGRWRVYIDELTSRRWWWCEADGAWFYEPRGSVES